MKIEKTTEKIPVKLNFAFDQMDILRREGLEDLKTFHLVKRKALEKERTRLTEKFGPDHQRVKDFEAKIQYNRDMMKDLDVVITEANIEVGAVDADTWKIHGRVFDSNRKGISDLTLGLYNEKGKWLKSMGFGCTDSRGYFFIDYSPKAEKMKPAASTEKLFLYVLNKDRQVLYKDSDSLFVTPGKIDYRAICLADESQVCTPPEPDKQEPAPPPATWVVKGRVVDKEGKGMAGLTVSLFDKDLLFDDYLGTRKTNDNGDFDFIYRREGFKDLFEKIPGIYLKVLDKDGKMLYTSKKPVKATPGEVKVFNIQIDTSKTRKGGKG